MRIASLADVKTRLSAYLDQCEKEGPIVITRNGKAVAVLLAPVSDDDLEMLLFARSPRFQSMLRKSRLSIRKGEGLSASAFWKAVAERHESERVSDRVRGKSTEKR
ncbi:MAG: type II toxin-antitoxin system Phd/YefM family antitoxin [Acidobacteria bacterium]|nr:type II toxin-antitoxin system Phd/YefM family antitoxin [Acidobacteriota bacterium]